MSIKSIEQLKQLMLKSNYTVIITGAGISTASGYPDLIGMNQITLNDSSFNAPLMQLLTNRFAQHNPHEFYRLYRMTHFLPQTRPSLSHQIIADFEKNELIKAVITFNLDHLHTLAGTKNVIEYWDSINDNYCIAKNHRFDSTFIQSQSVPHCPIDGSLVLPIFVIRNMVALKKAVTTGRKMLSQADLILALGTQLHHGLPSIHGKLVVINQHPVKITQPIALFIQGNLDQILTELHKKIEKDE
ncbi:SIR2 family NAD-dependent protein deacylase [Liquorilactobacillus mali]|uniref:SIR2 family NAD-dependent protein deacylase n=1 Tax=Liquorilactobacillus mali TaxID=1618 RepID=UPI0023508E1B|nr:Sir2 family NAD-dependent protein deacetylase [Liquorilactobacillus mali]MDC7952837.1 hypothetical protein [Liquorilactobacillus mali]